MKANKPDIIIGIDTGTKTGFAVWDTELGKLVCVDTLKLHEAFTRVLDWRAKYPRMLVRFEDARLRKFYGHAGREKLQGAGSIKRDAVIWEEFLSDYKIEFEAVAPKNNMTKINAEAFRNLTGYSLSTTQHSRDAAFLVFGY